MSLIATDSNFRLFQADAAHVPLEDKSVDLVFGSPPYCDARTYGINAQRGCIEWVEWMILCTLEAQRVCKGPVLWVAAGVTRKRNYWPACEGLMWEWWKRGGDCQLYRPCYWSRVGIPGSGGDDWMRADVEYVMCFKRPGALQWSDNTAMGHPPKWGPGGGMSHRVSNGARINQWGHGGRETQRLANGDLIQKSATRLPCVFGDNTGKASRKPNGEYKERYFNGNGFKKRHTKSRADGSDEVQEYDPPVLANPGNWYEDEFEPDELEYLRAITDVKVGGGLLGHDYAHANEAPFPEKLARRFIKSLCPPGGIVYDPFVGSGTTVAVAIQEGRIGYGSDIRQNQIEIARHRIKNPYAKREKEAAKEPGGLFV